MFWRRLRKTNFCIFCTANTLQLLLDLPVHSSNSLPHPTGTSSPIPSLNWFHTCPFHEKHIFKVAHSMLCLSFYPCYLTVTRNLDPELKPYAWSHSGISCGREIGNGKKKFRSPNFVFIWFQTSHGIWDRSAGHRKLQTTSRSVFGQKSGLPDFRNLIGFEAETLARLKTGFKTFGLAAPGQDQKFEYLEFLNWEK